MSFSDRALSTALKGVPVIRLSPQSKKAFDRDWPSLATTDQLVIEQWNNETPDANCGAVAQARQGGVWFFEIDDPSVVSRIEVETGQKIPTTYRVRSRPGRGHFYWRQTPSSIALGNVAQGFVKNGDFSVRVNNEYVVAAGSIHPNTGAPYEIVCTSDIAEAPEWLIDWIKTQRVEKKQLTAEESGPIPDGQRNVTLASLAGKMRNAGANCEEIEAYLTRVNDERCVPPLPAADISTIAASISRYPVKGDSTILTIGGAPLGLTPRTAYGVPPAPATVEQIEPPAIVLPPYPEFPRWVMEETSIYKGLVKPFCDVNSRYPEYMFMPAMGILLNILATRVQIKGKMLIPSLFMVLIGKRGEVIKSSSVESAIDYFHQGGMLQHAKASLSNANSNALVFEIASPEGFGLEMDRLKCKNAILYYDELSTLTNKAGIDGSTLGSRLLTLYESGKFQNVVKSKKESFSLEPNSYCVTLITCCTDKNFHTNWGKLSGRSSGLDDRFFFLFQPKILKERSPYVHVETGQAAFVTRNLIENAVKQGVYKISNSSPFADRMDLGNRGEIRAEKLALGFAVDLGMEEIEPECVERAIALVEYEKAVKKWLAPGEAVTKEGSIQMDIRNMLVRNGGSMDKRDLMREIHADRYGTTLWYQSFSGMQKAGQIMITGSGVKGSPEKVVLLQQPEEYDE